MIVSKTGKKKGPPAIAARRGDCNRFKAAVQRGELPEGAEDLAALACTSITRLREKYGDDVVQCVLHHVPSDARRRLVVPLEDFDHKRFAHVGAFWGMDDCAAHFAAGAVACLRRVTAVTKNPRIAMDILASTVPAKALKAWTEGYAKAA